MNQKNMRLNIEEVREKMSVSNRELAIILDCSPQWLTNIAREDKFCKNYERLLKLSRISGIPIAKLFTNKAKVDGRTKENRLDK